MCVCVCVCVCVYVYTINMKLLTVSSRVSQYLFDRAIIL